MPSPVDILKMSIVDALTGLHQNPQNREANARRIEHVLDTVEAALSDPNWVDKANTADPYHYALSVLDHALSNPSFGMKLEATRLECMRARKALDAIRACTIPDSPFKWNVLPGSPEDNGLA